MNIRLVPPLLIGIGAIVFLGFTVFGVTRNKTSNILKASVSSRLVLEGKLEKHSVCLAPYVCHYLVSKTDGQKYNISQKRYLGVTDIKNDKSLSEQIDLQPYVNRDTRVLGIWIVGDTSYLVISDLTIL